MTDDLVEAIVVAMKSMEARRNARATAVIDYRCSLRGCQLLLAWLSPGGLLFWKPAYKLPHSRNLERSSESGRAKNTSDGNNHWLPTAGRLDDLRPLGEEGWLEVNCDHRDVKLIAVELLAEADATKPGHAKPRML